MVLPSGDFYSGQSTPKSHSCPDILYKYFDIILTNLVFGSKLCPVFFYIWSKAMVVKPAVWEHQLLSWAHEAFTSPAIDSRIEPEADILDGAYDYCEHITRTNSRTFYLASRLLSRDTAARRTIPVCLLPRNR